MRFPPHTPPPSGAALDLDEVLPVEVVRGAGWSEMDRQDDPLRVDDELWPAEEAGTHVRVTALGPRASRSSFLP